MRIDPKPQLTEEEATELFNKRKQAAAIAVAFAGTFFFFVKIIFF